MMLEVSSLTMRFGGLIAVNDVNMTVENGEILGLIGPNGAGKTTLFNVVAGVFPPSSGTVTFDGTRIEGRSPNHNACCRKNAFIRTDLASHI